MIDHRTCTCTVCYSHSVYVYFYLHVMSCVWQLHIKRKYDDDDKQQNMLLTGNHHRHHGTQRCLWTNPSSYCYHCCHPHVPVSLSAGSPRHTPKSSNWDLIQSQLCLAVTGFLSGCVLFGCQWSLSRDQSCPSQLPSVVSESLLPSLLLHSTITLFVALPSSSCPSSC